MSTQPQQSQALAKVETSPLILELAGDWKISPVTMINTLKATIFPQLDRDKRPVVVTNEMMIAFLQVCNTFKLNPFVREIYAFPTKGGGIVPMVPIDGWANIINRNAQFDGLEFVDDWQEHSGKKSLFSTTCVIYRKDRSHPIRVTEYMEECWDGSKEPWKRWPARMLRHKALIQCARIAFSLGGIYDPDEAERVAESGEPVNGKPEVKRPERASAQVIDAQPVKESEASPAAGVPAQTVAGDSTEVAGQAPATANCLCTCCVAGECTCPGKEEFDRCACVPCKEALTAGPTRIPSMEEVFNNAPSTQVETPKADVPGKPAGPYVPQTRLAKLFAVAASAGIQVNKDSHDDKLHELLKSKYGIESVKEIPVLMFDQILQEIAPNLKVKK